MNKLEKFLFGLTIFLIPPNMFLKWVLPESYISGYLVDYLIPKLYLSDVSIILLLLVWIIKDWRKLGKIITLNKNDLLLISLIFAIFMRGLLSSSPLASTWYFFKFIELGLFFSWMRHHLSFSKFKKLMLIPLSISILFQSLLGVYQFLTQRSLVGYWLLGETTLNLSSQIDKVSILGRLIIPAYGTTAHSNVLGGFLSLGLLLLIYLYKNSNLKKFTIIIGMICLSLTFSITSWFGFMLGLFIYKINPLKVSVKGLIVFSLLSPILLVLLSNFFESISILRRIELLGIYWKMIQENFIFGVGLNNFTSVMNEYGSVVANTRFLQPVHNVLYLFFSEVGLIGVFVLVSTVFKYQGIALKYFGLLAVLIWLGTFDHYLLTLQTGQLLFVLLLFVTKSKDLSLWSE